MDKAKKEGEKKAKEEGYDMIWKRTLQYINGRYKIEKNIITFTPEKLDTHKIQTFKLIYKTKSKDLDYLIDENDKTPFSIAFLMRDV